jgi:hypothetical protein
MSTHTSERGNLILVGDITLQQDRVLVASGNVLTLPDGGNDELVVMNYPQTLTQKVISGNDNILSDIDASNIGSGTVNNQMFDSLAGVTGNVQTQLNVARVHHTLLGMTDISCSGGSYKVCSRFIFPGTDAFDPVQNAYIIARGTKAATMGKIRIYDVTNGNIICENANIIGQVATMHDLGLLEYQPASQAVWEVHGATTGGGGSLYVSGGYLCT